MSIHPYASDVAFTPAVKAIQTAKGSRNAFERADRGGGWETTITPFLAGFIARQRSALLATATKDGQPYIQHRGGPPGFLHVLDDKTIAFADFAGNRQYVTMGNLSENPKAFLFLLDHVQRRRVKIWGEAQVVEDDPELLTRLMPEGYRARGERVILFTVAAWDVNCQQHIPQRFDAEDVMQALEERDRRIGDLEDENAQLRALLEASGVSAPSSQPEHGLIAEKIPHPPVRTL
jgi:predicted pyridoxine 5'-phosphate oxidase superfamily flavin-nucleotide-binding protein